ncbi:MAG: NAD-dependent epimerase/dehydratase family protein [Acidobacteriota bacterium]|nr:NAD-dependent epimerase/dehydratase family protein [Blastocatellia bacterium]MDW8240563.1 NAD-dependent epimerase/dehydratase family protein [Acidobacteriota bacterium]
MSRSPDVKFDNVLVTGATGFVGGRLIERLAMNSGVRLRALVRHLEKARSLIAGNVDLVQGDITDRRSLDAALSDCDLVFHCAALMHDATTDAQVFHRVNVEGTRNMLEAALQAGVRRFVHVSSIAVYGTSPREGADETDEYQFGREGYANSKIESEQLALAYHRQRGLPVVVIRPANVYGPRSSFWTVWMIAMIKSGQLSLIDDGQGMANPVYIDNLVDAMQLAARHTAAVGEVFVVSDGTKVTWKEFLGYYARMVGRDSLPSMSRAEALSKLDPVQVEYWTQTGWFDITKARRMLGYEPRVSLAEGMKQTEQWLRRSGYI